MPELKKILVYHFVMTKEIRCEKLKICNSELKPLQTRKQKAN